MSSVLARVNHPHDLRDLSLDELKQLAVEIRQRIMEVVNVNGGHLASNLGTVEVTLALHRVFDFPKDRLVWDVSHQTYPHKLITGRKDRFHALRAYGGIAGFCNKRESIFDLFDAGHAGTAASLALGVAVADHVFHRGSKTIAVVGDAAIAAGMAFEALNHAGDLQRDLLVVLNDNRMSIDVSVGALSKYFNKIRAKPLYQDLKKDVHEILSRIPLLGRKVEEGLEYIHESLKHSLVPGLLFQELGFNYYGPVDGHNLESLIEILSDLKSIVTPVLLHVHTVKGHGYEPAAKNPIKYHALKNFLGEPEMRASAEPPVAEPAAQKPVVAPSIEKRSIESRKKVTYSEVFKETIHAAARQDRRIVAVTAAMPGGTGLVDFAKEFPDRYFDVGIAEQHGGAFSSGMAYGGLKPVFAVYSTFCQRAYDQIVHDTCIQGNSVVLCLDRGGLVEDGWTHHGVFDIAYLRCVPNTVLMAPRDAEEFVRMFQLALEQTTLVPAIRYPKANVPTCLPPPKDPVLRLGKAEVLREGEGIALHAYGAMVEEAWKAADILEKEGISVTVVNARFAKPLDEEILRVLARDHHTLVTLEEHQLMGGFGSAVLEKLADLEVSFSRVIRFGIPDRFQTFGAREKILEELGIDAKGIAAQLLKEVAAPVEARPARLHLGRMEAAGRRRASGIG
ncbi:MAG: 1-deoxy-D-xylulose-5-phosphate synthase [Planctomycetes bacterium]|nr:1-deoxy-D-xylulose-5-phosphate synthase [Planctomycetota bacterium]